MSRCNVCKALRCLVLLSALCGVAGARDSEDFVELRFYVRPEEARTAEIVITGTPVDKFKKPTRINGNRLEERQNALKVDEDGTFYTPFVVERKMFPGGQICYQLHQDGYATLNGVITAKNIFDPGNHFDTLPVVAERVEMQSLWLSYLGLGVAVGGVLVLGGGFFVYRSRKLRSMDIEAWVEAHKVPSSDENSPVGKLFGEYWILEELGRGGMATVYRARRNVETSEEIAAVKMVHPHLVSGEDFHTRFQREIDVGKKLNHPNIITVLEANEIDGTYYLALEFVEGSELRAHIPGGGFDLETALRYLLPIFDAVAYAHKMGIIHRDIKPGNVLIKADGTVKLSDFGLARAHDFSTVTATGAALGTPAYMAPEQIQGQPVDPASDQYALGVMSFQLTTGLLPFEEEEVMQLILKHLTATPPAPSSIKPELPSEFDEVVLRMMQKDPARRFASVKEAAAALRALQ